MLGALALAAVAAGTLSGCGGSRGMPGTVPGPRRTAVPAPDLCAKVKRKPVEKAIGGKAEHCETKTTPPDEHRVRFLRDAEPPPGDTAGKGRLTVAYRLRYDPRTGFDRWESLRRPEGDKRVAMLGVGDDAVFDYRSGAWPDLSVLKGDLIILITHDPAAGDDQAKADEKLPGRLTAVAEAVLAQTG